MEHYTYVMKSIAETSAAVMAALENGDYESAFVLSRKRSDLVRSLEGSSPVDNQAVVLDGDPAAPTS